MPFYVMCTPNNTATVDSMLLSLSQPSGPNLKPVLKILEIQRAAARPLNEE